MKRAFRLVASIPWAITPEMHATILSIAKREGPGIEAVEAELGRPLDNTGDRVSRRNNGVAVISVVGPIFRYANIFTKISGGTSIQLLARDLKACLDDPTVRAIVLDLNSPGGEVAGTHELAEMLSAARGRKPIAAYAGGTCASAAYWLAAATGRVVADATAIVGSIGVVCGVANPDAEEAAEIEIVSSQSPNKRPDVRTDDGRAQIQATVDALADVFVEDVARYRGISREDVLASAGGVFIGAAAITARLVDELGSLEGLVADMGARAIAPPAPQSAAQLAAPNPNQRRAMARRSTRMSLNAEDKTQPAPAPAPAPDKKPAETAAAGDMTCPECGAMCAAGSKFCAACGCELPPPAPAGDPAEQAKVALFALTGQEKVAAAVGIVHAWKDAASLVTGMQAKIAALEVENRAFALDKIIADAKAEKKITPDREAKARAMAVDSFDQAKAFVGALDPVAALQPPTREPEAVGGSVLSLNGKKFEDLKPIEQHNLLSSNEPLYRAMKQDFERRSETTRGA